MFTKSDNMLLLFIMVNLINTDLNFISFISFLCWRIFLDFKISCSGIRKIAQRLKCLLCNPEKLELIQRGRKRTYTTELPTGLHMCSMAILLLTLFYYLHKNYNKKEI